jgi:glycerophosphoryl diester phosphodiesterase
LDGFAFQDFHREGDPVTNYFLRDAEGILNIAHRGGAAVRPENTLLAFRHALTAGAAALEGDLHATLDGVVVVSHDATVDRTTNGSGAIKDKTFQQLRELDAGHWFTRDGGLTHPYRGRGLRIPTLDEVFCDPVLNRVPMILEIKQQQPSIVGDVLDLVRACHMEDRLTFGSYDQACLEEVRAEAAQRGMNIVTSLAAGEVAAFILTPLEAMTRGEYVVPGSLLQVPVDHEVDGGNIRVIDALFMAKAKALGIKVQVWTVNDPEEMRWLIDEMKVDGIITDDPQLLKEVLREPSAL